MTNFTLNHKNFEGLWDTSNMIILVNLDWLKTEFNDIQIDSIEKFVGDKSQNLTLRTANNTEIKIIGRVTFLILVFQIYKINLWYHLLSQVTI